MIIPSHRTGYEAELSPEERLFRREVQQYAPRCDLTLKGWVKVISVGALFWALLLAPLVLGSWK